MTIIVTRDLGAKMRHSVSIRQHSLSVDEGATNGGDDLGPTPHDLYDSAVASCKALTVLWFAQRKGIPVEHIEVRIDRDDSQERQGVYRLRTTLALTGPLSDEQRQMLLGVAAKCPVHKLITAATTEISTELAPAAP